MPGQPFFIPEILAMLMKLCPYEQNLVTDIFKSEWPPDVTLGQSAHSVHI